MDEQWECVLALSRRPIRFCGFRFDCVEVKTQLHDDSDELDERLREEGVEMIALYRKGTTPIRTSRPLLQSAGRG